MLFDTHVNLHAEQFAADLPDVLARARAAGVTRFVSICDRLDKFPAVRAIAHANDDITCTVGVHPHYAKDFWSLESRALVEEARDPKVVGIGETGLDQHYGYSDIVLQERSFVEHIHAARETGLVLVVHTREADDLTGDILEREYKHGPFRILMHCYTGGARLAQRALDLDARFSVSGILSFKAAQDVRDVTAKVPLDRIILETDCPYLAPMPHRGRRNEPAYLVDVCRAFAEHRGMSFEAAAELTTMNAIELFRRDA
ncbi:MAG TPA: TatD family hydrolase [Hyphomonadaceae bacterium]|jgi:TatD DNase family protein|nr:TatD family hydrolase [Hyphomonadaceae bacterium]